VVLAAQTDNINLIIGGHTHTFMEQPDSIKNISGSEVLVTQAGWAGVVLGRLDIVFERNKKRHCVRCKNVYIGSKD